MHYTILVDRNENLRQVEAQEQTRFLKMVFDTLEIEAEFNPDEPLSVEQKIKLWSVLTKYGITVIDDLNGGLKIFVERELIAEWRKPSMKLKQYLTKAGQKNRLHTEMSINFWTVFEQEEEKT
jgi:hypothetical protein